MNVPRLRYRAIFQERHRETLLPLTSQLAQRDTRDDAAMEATPGSYPA